MLNAIIDSIGYALFNIAIILIIVLYVWSIVWAYKDAEKRGKSGCLVALLVFFVTFPIGFIIWLVFRPDKKRSRE